MMRYFILFILVVFSGPAFAQWADNKIRVIGEDGSVQVLEIPTKRAAPVQSEPKVVVEAEEPQPKPVVKAALPVVTPPLAQKVEIIPDVPKPLRKPHVRPRAELPVVSEPAPEIVAPAPARLITKARATAIALEIAPPARSMLVQSRMISGSRAYAVIFKTEDGPYEILVDGLSGKIISAR